MNICDACTVRACRNVGTPAGEFPNSCPTGDANLQDAALAAYTDDDIRLMNTANEVFAEFGYHDTRVRQLIELARRMGWTRIGMAFCIGLRNEARAFGRILRAEGFTVEAAICKTGARRKDEIAAGEACEFAGALCDDAGKPIVNSCNPLAQALFLNDAGTDCNITLGLCPGHDMVFTKYSEAPVTCLIAKEYCSNHSPARALQGDAADGNERAAQ